MDGQKPLSNPINEPFSNRFRTLVLKLGFYPGATGLELVSYIFHGGPRFEIDFLIILMGEVRVKIAELTNH